MAGLFDKLRARTSPQLGNIPTADSSPTTPASHHSDTDDSRPGKFADLSATFYTGESPDLDKYKKCNIVQPRPGAIIHVHDTDRSRVDQRIFVVLREYKDNGHQCLTICIYDDDQPDHWKVALGDDAASTTTLTETMLIYLKHGCVVRPGITVNLSSPWMLESGSRIKVLGHVCDENWDAVLLENMRLHTEAGQALLSSKLRNARAKTAVAESQQPLEAQPVPHPVRFGTPTSVDRGLVDTLHDDNIDSPRPVNPGPANVKRATADRETIVPRKRPSGWARRR